MSSRENSFILCLTTWEEASLMTMWSGTKLTLQLSQYPPTRTREYTTKVALSSSWTSALRTLEITQLSKNAYSDQTFWYLDTYILINAENQPCKTFPADLCAVRITQPPPIWLTDIFCCFCPSEFNSLEVCYKHHVKIEVFKAENDTALLYGDIENSNVDKWIPCPDPVQTICSTMKGSITFRKVRLHAITATRAGKHSTEWQERDPTRQTERFLSPSDYI